MEVVQIPLSIYNRMCKALISIEQFLAEQDNNSNDWLTEQQALEMLGCSKRKLYYLKGKAISYKAIGKKHQYNRRSIESYIHKMSV